MQHPNVFVTRALFTVLLLVIVSKASAHEVRPGYLQLTQTDETTFQLLLKLPAKGNQRLGLYPTLPKNCNAVGEAVAQIRRGAYVERATVICGDGLSSGIIAIDGLSRGMTDVLVRIERLDNSTQIVRLTPANPAFRVESAQGTLEIARAYAVLGVEHILGGVDHMLFVLALLIIVGGGRRLVITITAFTIAHSVTLAGATLGVLRVPQQAVEAVIALSIVFVAGEIVHSHQGRGGLTQRWPWLVAVIFGLLHGFGFAGALTEVGLPQQAIPLALLLFNVGVEIGQLMFIGIVVLLAWLARKSKILWPRHAELLAAYGIGTVAAFWTIERTLGMLA